jgi:ubiquinone biosynthesis protein COQ9
LAMKSVDTPHEAAEREAQVRRQLAPFLAKEASVHGWSMSAVLRAAETVKIDADLAARAFAEGPRVMLRAWFDHVDAEVAAKLPAKTLATLKIRQRITQLIEARLEVLEPNREALRSALELLARPSMLRERGARLWSAADHVWRLAGDTSTDYNHYTKRGLVSAIYAATLRVFIDDTAPNFSKTRAFLSRRVDNVMQIEKLKMKLRTVARSF